ncbi:TGF-beta propeptide [bacterium BMS3Abin05]|nr:TGF-beta propeptide [bacterium BMS3Abin05]HDZ11801.1 DNRLRE domain-containing protein [Bacteroidota bacterium]
MKKTKFALILGLIGLIVGGCQSQKNPLSIEALQRKNLGEEKMTVIQKIDSFQTKSLKTQMGKSSDLFLGNAEGYSTSILLKFGYFKSIPDTAQIDSALLRLNAVGVINPENQTELPVDIYTAQSPWEETVVEPGDPAGQAAGVPIVSTVLGTRTGTYDSLSIPPKVVKGWQDSTIENNGLLLTAAAGKFIKSFYARENAEPPNLLVFFRVNGAADSVLIASEKDVSLVQSSWVRPDDRLIIGDGVGFTAYLKFSLPELPLTSTILRATLKLTVDTTASLIQEKRTYSLAKLMMKDEGGQLVPDSSEADTTRYDAGKNSLSVNITNFVQKWVSEKQVNDGLRLSPYTPGSDLYRLAFFVNAPDSTLNPKVFIYYSIPSEK